MTRILFVKTSSLGDVVQNCPAVSDAARMLPDAVIDSQALLKSAAICFWAAGTRHGMDAASAREPLAARFYDVLHTVSWRLHAVERNRRLTAEALGFALDEDLRYGLRAEGASPLEEGSSYAVFLTMTSRKDKLWPESRWIETGRALDMDVVLPWGNDAERGRAERIRAAVPRAIVPRRMALEELARLFVHARGVIGLDTGLTHLAAALGVATVGIYCGSDPALNGLYGAPQAKNVGGPGRPPEASEVLKQCA